MSSAFQQRRVSNRVDRDNEPFDSSDLDDEESEDDGDVGVEDESRQGLIAKNDTLHGKKLLHMGNPIRTSARLPLHLMKFQEFQVMAAKAREQLKDVQTKDGYQLELLDPPNDVSHNINCQISPTTKLSSLYKDTSCEEFFVYVPLFLISVYFFHIVEADPLCVLFTFSHVAFFATTFMNMPKRAHTRGREVRDVAFYPSL